MAGLRLIYKTVAGEFRDGMKEIYKPMAVAGKAAMVETAEEIKSKGRAQIAAAGFKRNSQTAFRGDVYPRGNRPSVNAAAMIYHKFNFFEVFEEGALINGKPIMWVPIRDKRTRVGAKQLRLKDFKARGEKLILIKRAGKPPLLVGRPLSGMKQPRRRREREGYSRYDGNGMVPLFVGISLVKISKKLAIYPMIEREGGLVAQRYFKAIAASSAED
jgi:hypothetical protein